MIRWDLAEADINDTGATIIYKEEKYYLCRGKTFFYDAPTKEALIEDYFHGCMEDYTYPDNIKCECGNCHKEALYFKCPGCQPSIGYCLGGSDEYQDYCDDCWYQLTHDLLTVVINK